MRYFLDIPAIVYRDISGIRDYIASDNPSAANRTAEKLFRAVEGLADNPLAYGELKKKFGIETDLRARLQKPYVVLFRIDGDTVKVYRVLDGRSDYLAALNLLNTPREDGEE
ncbi:MAG: type II toxin-antitoxin system RelE/ParE family toxin [Clostridiales bacterium]|jgi:plasmid stabilization system protein ParE|nr:type II toxin-antitoxin system RelE/ParE family toxin [Clostridiales bacterium]